MGYLQLKFYKGKYELNKHNEFVVLSSNKNRVFSLYGVRCGIGMRFKIFKYFIFAIFTLCSLWSLGQVVPPTELCASVNPDNSITISWQTPNPQPESYNLYRNNNDGSGWNTAGFAISATTNSFIDQVATPGVGSVSYYMISVNNNIDSQPSDTISTIFLELTPDSQNSVAELEWNAPNPNSSGGQYQIYRQIQGELSESSIATLPSSIQTYRDTLYGLCVVEGDSLINVSYTVHYLENNCDMSSNAQTDGFQDALAPKPPEIETILTNPFTGNAQIYWYPPSEPDLLYYRIQNVLFQPDDTLFLPVDSLESDVSQYIYMESNQAGPTNLVVIAYDSCGNDISFSQIAITMFLEAQYTICDQQAKVKWTPYEGWDEGVSGYTLHISNENANYSIDLQPGDIQSGFENIGNSFKEVNSFMFDVSPNLEYCVYIEAKSNGDQRPSTSNMSCFTTNYPEVVDFAYNSRATTTGDKAIQVDLLQDTTGVGTTYALYRSEAGNSFQPVTTLAQTSNQVLSYTDNDVDARNIIYEYKWTVYDGCGQELFDTNTGRNMVLQATPDKNTLINTLRWNHYQDWENGVDEYEIYRKLGSESDFSYLATVAVNQELVYEDNIEEFLENEGQFCYQIVAKESDNTYDFSTTSESNVSCATVDPLMWIPNTIVINGHNNVFKPVAGFIDFQSFEMEIYNKWGERIFYSDDINEGWDGTVHGKQVREDMYQYIIVYRDGSGQAYVNQGALYVLIGNP